MHEIIGAMAAAVFLVTGTAYAQAPAEAATAPATVTQAVETAPVIEGATSWVVVEVRTPAATTAETQRLEALRERERALDARQAALDQRQQALDERTQTLDARQSSLDVQATQLAGTVTVRDAFQRDANLSERSAEGPDRFAPGVDTGFTPGVDGGTFAPGPRDTVTPFFTTRDPPETP